MNIKIQWTSGQGFLCEACTSSSRTVIIIDVWNQRESFSSSSHSISRVSGNVKITGWSLRLMFLSSYLIFPIFSSEILAWIRQSRNNIVVVDSHIFSVSSEEEHHLQKSRISEFTCLSYHLRHSFACFSIKRIQLLFQHIIFASFDNTLWFH